MTQAPAPRLVAAVAAGGALGALGRWGVDEALAARAGDLPWPTLLINVVGAFLLALLPAIAAVRRSPTLTVALGPGVLGGFTTLSAYSEQARALLAADRPGAALVYLGATLAACLVAVAAADRWSTARERRRFARAGGDE